MWSVKVLNGVVQHLVKEVSTNFRSLIAFILYIVQCRELTDPMNGMISCSLGDDGVSLYEDTCSFTCNTGYKLTGSDTRTCQGNGSWSGSDVTCTRGSYIICIAITILE